MSDGKSDRARKQPAPSGLFYQRLIPVLLILMGIILAAVIALSVLAMIGIIPSG